MQKDDLLAAVLDIEAHVSANGWDQPTLLFALVPSEAIRASRPDLAERLGIAAGGPALTSFEQPAPPADQDLGEFLAGISWPEDIAAAAVVVERIVLPPQAEADLAASHDALRAARQHAQREDVRIVVAADRAGQRMCALRLRSADTAEDVRAGEDLVPGLAEAIAATFR